MAEVLVDLAARPVGEPRVGDRVATIAVGDQLQHRGAALLARAESIVAVACATASRSLPSTRSAGRS